MKLSHLCHRLRVYGPLMGERLRLHDVGDSACIVYVLSVACTSTHRLSLVLVRTSFLQSSIPSRHTDCTSVLQSSLTHINEVRGSLPPSLARPERAPG